MQRHHRNNRKPFVSSASLLLALYAVSTTAMAHPGHGEEGGLLMGFAHPFGGLDHLLVMFGVGMWSAMSAKRAWPDLLWAPLGFIALLLAGALLGVSGASVPYVEPAIALSVVGIGLLIALRARMRVLAAAAVVGTFAVFHGLVHGQAFAAAPEAAAAVAGLLAATATLHLLGVAMGGALRNRQRPAWTRFAGGAITVAGIVLLAGLVV